MYAHIHNIYLPLLIQPILLVPNIEGGGGGVLNGKKLKLTKIVASGLECKGEP